MTWRAKLKRTVIAMVAGYLAGRSVQVIVNTHAMVERQEARYMTHQDMARRACWGAFPFNTFNVSGMSGVPDVICYEPRNARERAQYLAHFGQRPGERR